MSPIAQLPIPTEVATKEAALYIVLAILTGLVIYFLRHLSKRDDRDDKRTLAFAQTLSDVSERSETAAKTQSEACHLVQRECIDRCEAMQSESNATIKEATKAMVLHSEAIRSCDRCGNFKAKEEA